MKDKQSLYCVLCKCCRNPVVSSVKMPFRGHRHHQIPRTVLPFVTQDVVFDRKLGKLSTHFLGFSLRSVFFPPRNNGLFAGSKK